MQDPEHARTVRADGLGGIRGALCCLLLAVVGLVSLGSCNGLGLQLEQLRDRWQAEAGELRDEFAGLRETIRTVKEDESLTSAEREALIQEATTRVSERMANMLEAVGGSIEGLGEKVREFEAEIMPRVGQIGADAASGNWLGVALGVLALLGTAVGVPAGIKVARKGAVEQVHEERDRARLSHGEAPSMKVWAPSAPSVSVVGTVPMDWRAQIHEMIREDMDAKARPEKEGQ